MRRTLSFAMLSIVLSSSLSDPVRAQDNEEEAFIGTWEGQLAVPGASLRIVFHFDANEDGSLGGSMDSPDQGASGIPLGSVSTDGNSVNATVPSAAGSYEGQLTEDSSGIEGSWSQGGQSFPLSLKRRNVSDEVKKVPPGKPDIDVVGSWVGTLEAGAVELRIVFHLKEDAAGVLNGTMDSPDQGATGILLGEISGSGNGIKILVPGVAGRYEGKIEKSGEKIVGTWSQGGRNFPLDLELLGEQGVLMPERPQQPGEPYPYRQEELRFDNHIDGIQLAGTLTIPDGSGPFPAAVLISGSGPQNRDAEMMGHRPFLVLADHLARNGIAVLRFDDRGFGESGGVFMTATSEDFAQDATSGLELLRARHEIDDARIGLIGHSEGGLIAPMVAAVSQHVAYLVLMAGPGVPGEEILYKQAALLAAAGESTVSEMQELRDHQERIYAIITASQPAENVRTELRSFLQSRFDTMTEDERAATGMTAGSIEPQVQQLTTPWFRFFLAHDPRPVLKEVTCPVLAMNGENDLQVAPGQNLPEIEKALNAGGNMRATIVEMPGLNHLFQHSDTGLPSEYARIEETFAPEALNQISSWILALDRGQ